MGARRAAQLLEPWDGWLRRQCGANAGPVALFRRGDARHHGSLGADRLPPGRADARIGARLCRLAASLPHARARVLAAARESWIQRRIRDGAAGVQRERADPRADANSRATSWSCPTA